MDAIVGRSLFPKQLRSLTGLPVVVRCEKDPLRCGLAVLPEYAGVYLGMANANTSGSVSYLVFAHGELRTVLAGDVYLNWDDAVLQAVVVQAIASSNCLAGDGMACLRKEMIFQEARWVVARGEAMDSSCSLVAFWNSRADEDSKGSALRRYVLAS